MREEEIQAGDIIFYKLLPLCKTDDLEHRALVKRKKFIEPDIWMLSVQEPEKFNAEWIFPAQVTRKEEEK